MQTYLVFLRHSADKPIAVQGTRIDVLTLNSRTDVYRVVHIYAKDQAGNEIMIASFYSDVVGIASEKGLPAE